MTSLLPFLGFFLAATVSAKTDLTGCTTTDLTSPAGASQAWYVPGTGELCDPLDCGGGRAPPKSSVPGCPAYTGTETYSPSFLSGYVAAISTATTDTPTSTSTGAVDITSSSGSIDTTFIASTAHIESTEGGLMAPTSTSTGTGTSSSPVTTVTPTSMPLICGGASDANPNCGVTSTSLTSSTSDSSSSGGGSGGGGTITSSATSTTTTGTSSSESMSLTISLVRTVPTVTSSSLTTGALTASGSGAAVSTGGVAGIKDVVSGGLGLVVAALGGWLVVL